MLTNSSATTLKNRLLAPSAAQVHVHFRTRYSLAIALAGIMLRCQPILSATARAGQMAAIAQKSLLTAGLGCN